jgi:hypothetical protein
MDGSSRGDGNPLAHHLFELGLGCDGVKGVAAVPSVEKAIDECRVDVDKGGRTAALIHASWSMITE